MRGRKPRPSIIRRLEGNPGKRPLNHREPLPPAGVPDCPDYLDDVGRAEWFHTVRVLADMRLLTVADRTALAAYCSAYSRWRQAEDQVRRYGTVVKSPIKGFPMKSPYLVVADQALEAMRKFLTEFGLTPSSRSRLRVPEDVLAACALDRFLEGEAV